jgi:hypothetical protein
MDILRDKLKSDRKLIVAHNMELTDAEGKAFWPVYDAYMKDLASLNKRMIDLIADYATAYNKGPVSNADAKNLLERAFKIDADECSSKILRGEARGQGPGSEDRPLGADRKQDSRGGPVRPGGQHSPRRIAGRSQIKGGLP